MSALPPAVIDVDPPADPPPGPRRRRRGRKLAIGTLLASGLVFLVGVLAAGASQTEYTLDVRIRGDWGPGSHNPIEFDGKTFDQVAESFEKTDRADTPSGEQDAVLRIAPNGFEPVDVQNAQVTLTEDTASQTWTITVRGHTGDFWNTPGEMVAIARWEDSEANNPTLGVFFKFTDMDMLQIEESFSAANLDLTLSTAWIALSRNEGVDAEVDPEHFPHLEAFFDDGIEFNEDTWSVPTTFLPAPGVLPPATPASHGIAFRAVVSPAGPIANAATQLGFSDQVRLDGTVSQGAIYGETCPLQTQGSTTCAKEPNGTRQKIATGLSLTAHLEPVADPNLPDQVQLDAGWELTVKAQLIAGGGDTIIKVALGGTSAVELSPGEVVNAGFELTFEKDGLNNRWIVSAAGIIGNIDLTSKVAFKQIVLRFTYVAQSGTGSGGGSTAFTITGTGVLDLDPLIGHEGEVDMDLILATGSNGFAFTLSGSLETGEGVGLSSLFAGSGAPAPDVPFDMTQFGLSISIITGSGSQPVPCSPQPCTNPPSHNRIEITVTAQTSIAVTGLEDMNTDVLVVLSIPLGGSGGGSGGIDFLVVAKPSQSSGDDITLSELLNSPLDFDIPLPDFFISVASRTFDQKPEFLNSAVEAFVETQDDPRFKNKLFYREGVTIKADIDLGEDIADALATIGVETEGKLRLTGVLPLFGSPTWGIQIETPEIKATGGGPVRGGKVKLVLGRDWVDAQVGTSKTMFQMGIVGEITVAVKKAHVKACDGVVDVDAHPECFDLLKFSVGAEFTKSTSGTAFTFRGAMFTERVACTAEEVTAGRDDCDNPIVTDVAGWDEPFGIAGLTIHTVAIEFALERPTVGPAGVAIGIGGAIEIGGVGNISASARLSWVVGSPVPQVQGLFFAVEELELRDVADLYNKLTHSSAVIPPAQMNLIPDLRLLNVVFSYGQVDAPEFCIRAGIFMSGELHIGGTKQGEIPPCTGDGTLPPKDPPVNTAECRDTPSCLGAVVVDYQLGTTPDTFLNSKVVLQGFFSKIHLGPAIELNDVFIDIELSIKDIRFHLEGNGNFHIVGFSLLTGDFLVDIGTEGFKLHAEARLVEAANGGLLIFGLQAAGNFDFSDPQWSFDIWLRSPALDWLGQQIDQGWKDFSKAVNDFGTAVEQTADAAWTDVVTWLETLADREEYDSLDGVASIRGLLQQVEDYQQGCLFHKQRFEGDFLWDSVLEPIFGDCGTADIWRAIQLTSDLAADLPDDAPQQLVEMLDGGFCETSRWKDNLICNGSDVLPSTVAMEVITADFETAAQQDLAQPVAFTGGLTAAGTIDALYGTVDAGSAAASCARMTFDSATGQISNLDVVMEVDGNEANVSVPLTGDEDIVATGDLFQESVESLVTGGESVACDEPEPHPDFAPTMTMEFSREVIFGDGEFPVTTAVEGALGHTIARGIAPDGADEVIVDWGDGSTPVTVQVAADGTWEADHTFDDSGTFQVSATASGETVSRRLPVGNVRPSVSATLVNPPPVDEGDPDRVQLAVNTFDAGTGDTLTVTVYWGDGTEETYEVGGGSENRLLGHVYADDAPGLADLETSIVVAVIDDDGGSSFGTEQITVANVAPSVSIEAIDEAGEAVPMVVDETIEQQFRVTVDDPGVLDTHKVTITWGDGTTSTLPASAWTNDGSAQRAAIISHAWDDDDPTDTPQDDVAIGLEVIDDDGGVSTSTANVTIRSVAPTVALDAIDIGSRDVIDAIANEGATLFFNVGIDDPSEFDSHRVLIDWGDGTTTERQFVSEADDPTTGIKTASHTWVDDDPTDTPQDTYMVTMTVTDDDGVAAETSLEVTVRNVAPTIGIEPVDPAETTSEGAPVVDETQPLSWRVTIDDAGVADSHTVVVDWGDDTFTEVQLAAPTDGSRERSTVVTHAYADDDPNGTAEDLLEVRASVLDDDGGVAGATADVLVRNLAPTLSIEPAATDVDEASALSWQVTVEDPSLADHHEVTLAWGDGTSETIELAPSGSTTRTATVNHTWVDDNPTGTPSDHYTVTAEVTDDDTGTDAASADITVHNVAPTLTIEPAAGEVDEGSTLEWTVTVDDVGLADTHRVDVDWGDGTSETIQLTPSGSTTRTATVSHTWIDDDPTGTASDSYTVQANVVDDDTGGDSASADITVHNVAPAITALTLSATQQDENEQDVTLDLSFTDPGTADSHTVIVDWGDGWTAGTTSDTNVAGQDVRTSQVDVPANGTTDASLQFTNRYGDNGVYTITVTVIDDDTGQIVDTRTLTVDNVAPTQQLDRSTAIETAGGLTWILETDEEQSFTTTASDPGSDDLRFDWDFGDGHNASSWWNWSIADYAETAADGLPSPQVAAVDATNTVSHAWEDGCLHGLSTTVTDDDGATSDAAFTPVAVQRERHNGSHRTFADWRHKIYHGDLSQERLDCYLDVAGHLSTVLLGPSEVDDATEGGDPTPWSTATGITDTTVRYEDTGVPTVLAQKPGCGNGDLEQEQIRFDRALLATWLNYADGRFGWTERDKDGLIFKTTGDPFHEVMAELEHIRLTSDDEDDVRDAREELWDINDHNLFDISLLPDGLFQPICDILD